MITQEQVNEIKKVINGEPYTKSWEFWKPLVRKGLVNTGYGKKVISIFVSGTIKRACFETDITKNWKLNVITPRTPYYKFNAYKSSQFSKEFVDFVGTADRPNHIKIKYAIINNRLCSVYGLKNAYGLTNSINITVLDRPKPTKLRQQEIAADRAFCSFCKNEDWGYLFRQWKSSYSDLFCTQLMHNLEDLIPKNCNTCRLRFSCWTEGNEAV